MNVTSPTSLGRNSSARPSAKATGCFMSWNLSHTVGEVGRRPLKACTHAFRREPAGGEPSGFRSAGRLRQRYPYPFPPVSTQAVDGHDVASGIVLRLAYWVKLAHSNRHSRCGEPPPL